MLELCFNINDKITGKAEQVVVTSADISLYTDSYTLSWTVLSKSQVTDFHIQFKETSGSEWTSMEVKASKYLHGSWQGSALLSHLRSATQYDAKVSSKNDFGYSEARNIFNFATKGAGMNEAISFKTQNNSLKFSVPYHQPSVSGVKKISQLAFTSLLILVSLIRIC